MPGACLRSHVGIKHSLTAVLFNCVFAPTHTHTHLCPLSGCEKLKGKGHGVVTASIYVRAPDFLSVTQKNAQTHTTKPTVKPHLTDTRMRRAAITWRLWYVGTATREFPTWLHADFKACRCCTPPCCVSVRVCVCVYFPRASMSTCADPFLPVWWNMCCLVCAQSCLSLQELPNTKYFHCETDEEKNTGLVGQCVSNIISSLVVIVIVHA